MRLGILGGGQLGMMLARAARDLDLHALVVEPKADCSAARVAPVLAAAYDDDLALSELSRCDVVTYEFENVPLAAAESLAKRLPVRPTPAALGATADRLVEKRFFRSLGIPTAAFRSVDSLDGLRAAVAELGLPAVLKTRRLGYDGKGQALLRHASDVEPAWRRLLGTPLVLEAWVPFEREISLIAVRGCDGAVRFWAPTENRHVDGILAVSRAPARDVSPDRLALAREWLTRILEQLDYVGVLTVELFETASGWLANEAACRVHNSGHWTLEGALTSQFENHVRAVAGLPLERTESRDHAAMVNLVGALPEAPPSLPGCHLHDYGKAPAPGRKLGHVTLTGPRPRDVDARLRALARELRDPAVAAALDLDPASASDPAPAPDRASASDRG